MARRTGRARAGAWVLARRLYDRFNQSRLPLLAAALAYYAAFSLGPLLLLLGGWFSVVLQARPELAAQYQTGLRDLVAQLLPLQPDSAELVTRSFELILDQLSQGALLRSVVSLVVLVWASSNFFTSLQLALEVIFDVDKQRGFWRKRLVAVLLVMAVVAVIAIEVVGGVLVSSLMQLGDAIATRLDALNIDLPLPGGGGRGFWTWLLRFSIAGGVFTLCFRYLPRTASTWAGAAAGALFAIVSLQLTRAVLLMSFNVERFNLIYGVITSLLLVLLWLYLALLLFLVGALLAAEISASIGRSSATTHEGLEGG